MNVLEKCSSILKGLIMDEFQSSRLTTLKSAYILVSKYQYFQPLIKCFFDYAANQTEFATARTAPDVFQMLHCLMSARMIDAELVRKELTCS